MFSRASVLRAVVVVLSLGLCACEDSGGGADAGADSTDAGRDAGVDDAGSNDAGSDDAGSDDAGSDDAGTGDAGTGDAGTGDAGPTCSPSGVPATWTPLREYDAAPSSFDIGQLAATYAGDAVLVAAQAPGGVTLDRFDAVSLALEETRFVALEQASYLRLAWAKTRQGWVLQAGTGRFGEASRAISILSLDGDGRSVQADGGLTFTPLTALPDGALLESVAPTDLDGDGVLALYGSDWAAQFEGAGGTFGTVLYRPDGGIVRGPTAFASWDGGSRFIEDARVLPDGGVFVVASEDDPNRQGPRGGLSTYALDLEAGTARDAGSMLLPLSSPLTLVRTSDSPTGVSVSYRLPLADTYPVPGFELVMRPLPIQEEQAQRVASTPVDAGNPWHSTAGEAGDVHWAWVTQGPSIGDFIQHARLFVKAPGHDPVEWTPDAGPYVMGSNAQWAKQLLADSRPWTVLVARNEGSSVTLYAVRACSP